MFIKDPFFCQVIISLVKVKSKTIHFVQITLIVTFTIDNR